ncbi:hypothetical protein PInf_020290 [Phytophthora infestans]|nr:hypothetical protein PInf_020290 [Phytophthora infestans]
MARSKKDFRAFLANGTRAIQDLKTLQKLAVIGEMNSSASASDSDAADEATQRQPPASVAVDTVSATEAQSPEVHISSSGDRKLVARSMEKRHFAGWDNFFEYLDKYQDETYQVFRKRTSPSIEARNTDLMRRGKGYIYNTYSSLFRKVLLADDMHAWMVTAKPI